MASRLVFCVIVLLLSTLTVVSASLGDRLPASEFPFWTLKFWFSALAKRPGTAFHILFYANHQTWSEFVSDGITGFQGVCAFMQTGEL